jgi:hypothetical protein
MDWWFEVFIFGGEKTVSTSYIKLFRNIWITGRRYPKFQPWTNLGLWFNADAEMKATFWNLINDWSSSPWRSQQWVKLDQISKHSQAHNSCLPTISTWRPLPGSNLRSSSARPVSLLFNAIRISASPHGNPGFCPSNNPNYDFAARIP